MAKKVKNYVTNNILFSENKFIVKEEFEDNDYVDDKMCISQTTITEAIDCERDDRVKQHTVDIKIESSSEICKNSVNHNVKTEDGVYCANHIKFEFDSGLLFCNHCQEVYRDYCTKCGMLLHVLNTSTLGNIHNGESEEIPKVILEIRELFGCLGIFSLKVIPEGVKFGPFTGLSISECCWRLKSGRLVVSEDKSKYSNWMRHINPARSISEQNLFAFQCNNNLYYRSIREIPVDEELLVYFGEEYHEHLNKDIEMDFIPTVEENRKDVFGCTFCCLGFSSKIYLSRHKTICLNKINQEFSSEELTQCPFCKIYLDKEEYFEYHMSYCSERNDRKCIPLKPDNQTIGTNGSTTQGPPMHKCTQCNYETVYKGDLKRHTVKHLELKIYKCEICNRRFKMKEYLKKHVETIHDDFDWDEARKWFGSEHMETHVRAKRSKGEQGSPDEVKQFRCSECEFQTKDKYYLKRHTKAIHLKQFNYACEICQFKTNRKLHLERHVKAKHLKEFSHECKICDYKTNEKTALERHIKTKHLKEFSYNCASCEFKTNHKRSLVIHVQKKHLKEFQYKCEICNYGAIQKSHLVMHIKTEHLKEFEYNCDICKFATNYKNALEAHVKSKHLKEFNYNCEMCEYRTNRKTYLEIHIKSKHLQEFKYECEACEFKTNLKANLEYHTKTKHLKEFNYNCVMCGHQTNHKTNLENHIKRKHLKEFKYKCEMCKYKTNLQLDLQKHIKTKHLKEFKYKCEMCRFITNFKSHFEKHIKSKHLKEFDYECDVCGYKTNRKTDLENHIKSKHLKEFRHKCEICKFETNWKSHLNIHIKTKHLKEFNYKCEMCHYKTNEKHNFEIHRKRKHLK